MQDAFRPKTSSELKQLVLLIGCLVLYRNVIKSILNKIWQQRLLSFLWRLEPKNKTVFLVFFYHCFVIPVHVRMNIYSNNTSIFMLHRSYSNRVILRNPLNAPNMVIHTIQWSYKDTCYATLMPKLFCFDLLDALERKHTMHV